MFGTWRIHSVLPNLFFVSREQKKCLFSQTFLDPGDFSERTKRSGRSEGSWSLERRVVESGVKGRGVWSEGGQRVWSGGGGPLWGCRNVRLSATLRGRRSDPERLELRGVSGENVGGRRKTSERTSSFFCSRVQKNKKRQRELVVLPI